MPGMDRLQVLQAMLADNPAAFIVIDSAENTAENVRTALGLGAKGFIVKPCNMQKVRDILDSYFVYISSPEDVANKCLYRLLRTVVIQRVIGI